MFNEEKVSAESRTGELEDLEGQQPIDDDEKPRTDNEPHSKGQSQDDTSKDPNIVDWDGPRDPSNPRNWTTKAKLANTSLVIVLTLLTPLASSMFAPGVPQVLRDFNTSAATIAEFVVSIYILGFAVGPLIISPLSEIYGRYPVYVACNIMFLIFTIACAVADSMSQLIVFRFFAGLFGVCPVTLGGASISDLIEQEKRGLSMSLFGMGPLLGMYCTIIPGKLSLTFVFRSRDRSYCWSLSQCSCRLALDVLGIGDRCTSSRPW